MQRFHPGGVLAAEATYVGGRLHGVARGFDTSGAPKYEREYRDDEMWHGEHEIEGLARGRYENGKKVGPWEQWTYDKKIKERGTYVDGKRHGAFELRESDGESWTGTFDMGERVGDWEVQRARSKVVAKGEYPRGARVPWTATLGERSVAIDVATPDELGRWIKLVEQWFTGRGISDFKGWPADERMRASEWVASRVVTNPPVDEEDEGLPYETAGRDVLVYATGDISALAHSPSPAYDDEDDYMERWYPPTRGMMIVVGTIDLPRRVIVDSPESLDERRVFAFRAGTYELAGLDSGHRLDMPLAIVRLPGRTIATWRYLGMAHDDNYAIVAAGMELGEWPGYPKGANGPAEWIVPATNGVWFSNPAGNGIRAYAGVAVDGDIVALFLQLY